MRDIGSELDRAFEAAKANALSDGVKIDDTIGPLHAIHKALKANHASGELTDEQFTERASELLDLILESAVVSLFVRQGVSKHNG